MLSMLVLLLATYESIYSGYQNTTSSCLSNFVLSWVAYTTIPLDKGLGLAEGQESPLSNHVEERKQPILKLDSMCF